MSKVTIKGTIETIDSIDDNCYITLQDHTNWFITIDPAVLKNSEKLKTGSRYIFTGELTAFSPAFTVQNIAENIEEAKQFLTMEADTILQGRVSDITYHKTMRGDQIAYVKIEDLDNINVIIMPYMLELFRQHNRDDSDLILIGSLKQDKMQYDITEVDYTEY